MDFMIYRSEDHLSMRMERKYIDSETGFFSPEYLSLLSGTYKNKNYEGGLGILISTEDDTTVIIDILKKSKPTELDIIRISKGTFFLVGDKKPRSVLEIFKQNLNETAKEEGINLSVKYDLRGKGENAEELLERLV